MTTADVSAILTALADLTARVNNQATSLARIEERTTVLSDHESRLRNAEEAARIAGETAIRAQAVAEGQQDSIRALEDRLNSSGKFTLTTVWRVVLGAVTFLLAVLSISAIVINWG